MKKLTLTAFAVFLAGPLVAQDAPMVEDSDGNGTYSMEEMTAAMPDLTPEVFAQIDTSADGEVDATEWEAAVAAGLITAG
ncbi:EF-hand domain-containing protein [Vannielia sp.]|uniref:EF-hand domain-containing protein n=1 Tax=Vannielia sp. TaxID=2813045 RepID=UPI0026190F35|nr:EF-hand domain-containing protein [Vannielia sp.]MDF1873591.1 EF-hand domain-containing protein [Vannielia sp.]